MNFIHIDTLKVVTPTYIKMILGIDEYNLTSALKAGYGYIEYQYPEFNADYYTIKPKAEPTKMEGQEGRYVQEFDIVDRPLDELKANIKAKVTSKRWDVETGGMTLPNGIKVLTGIDDQNRVATSVQGMEAAGLNEIDFKAESGWVKLSLTELKGISVALTHHVEACFARERELHEAIDACQTAKCLETIEQEDMETGWPNA